MMMPSIFGENLFDDDWMNFPFEQTSGEKESVSVNTQRT